MGSKNVKMQKYGSATRKRESKTTQANKETGARGKNGEGAGIFDVDGEGVAETTRKWE